MRREHFVFYLSPALLAVMLVGIVAWVRSIEKPDQRGDEGEDVYREVMGWIERDHVSEIPRDELIWGAVKGMMDTLDPYSRGYTPQEWKELGHSSSGHNPGIGIRFGRLDGRPTILRVIPGSPAGEAGLRSGDRIVAIDQEPVIPAANATEIRDRIVGPEGTGVRFTVESWDGKDVREVLVKRGSYKLETVYGRRYGDTAYLRISSFNKQTGSDLSDELERLVDAGTTDAILDLRANRGGSLEAAVEVVAAFVTTDRVLVSVSRDGDREYPTSSNCIAPGLPLVVIVNLESASASEVVAGALQDLKRALVVGEPTYGKGVVQNLIPLRSRPSGIKLTTARYYTPSGRSLQRSRDDDANVLERGGIIPDYRLAMSRKNRDRLEARWQYDRFEPFVLEAMKNDAAWNDVPLDAVDSVLDRARDILAGKDPVIPIE